MIKSRSSRAEGLFIFEWKQAWPENGSHEKNCNGYMKKTVLEKKPAKAT